MARAAIAALVALSVLAGCAAPAPRDDDLRIEAASHAFGGSFDYLFVESGGDAADRAFIAMSRVTGSSELAKTLAARIAAAREAPVRMLVSGPNAQKTVRVILDALDLQHGRSLPHLELLYLGDEYYAARLRGAVEALDGRFRFAPYAT